MASEAVEAQSTANLIPVCESPAGKKLPPHQGGVCGTSWVCCYCKFLIKSGKWNLCQNPSEHPYDKSSPGRVQRQCRHERCDDCFPKVKALWPGFEHIALRRWPPDGLVEDEIQIQIQHATEMADNGGIQQVDELITAKEKGLKSLRDQISGFRIGPWPGGF